MLQARLRLVLALTDVAADLDHPIPQRQQLAGQHLLAGDEPDSPAERDELLDLLPADAGFARNRSPNSGRRPRGSRR